jgi:hypothetical protein
LAEKLDSNYTELGHNILKISYLLISHHDFNILCGGVYSGSKITDCLGNVTVRGEKRWKEQGGSAIVNSLSEHV